MDVQCDFRTLESDCLKKFVSKVSAHILFFKSDSWGYLMWGCVRYSYSYIIISVLTVEDLHQCGQSGEAAAGTRKTQ